MRIRRISAPVAAFAIAMSIAGAAGAQGAFSMTGKAATGTGVFLRLPAVGTTACPSITAVTYTHYMGGGGPNVALNPGGCIPGGPAIVNVNGTGGFTFPVDFFSQPAPGALNVVPFGLVGGVVQLATSFAFAGPPAAPVEPISGQRNVNMATPTFAYAPWRVLKQSAWLSQTGRLAPDFTACPKAPGALACTNPNQATLPAGGGGYVKNSAAGGGFGGTFGLVLEGGLNVSSLAQGIAFVGGGGGLAIVPLPGMGSRGGRGYGAYDTDALGAAPIYAGFMLTSGGVISMLTGPILGSLPTQFNRNWGWAWTTGTILVRGTGMFVVGSVPVGGGGGTFSLQGFDNRTSMGAGDLQLVAGGVSQALFQGPNATPSYSVLRLSLPEPGAVAQLVAGVLGLLAVATWRVRAR